MYLESNFDLYSFKTSSIVLYETTRCFCQVVNMIKLDYRVNKTRFARAVKTLTTTPIMTFDIASTPTLTLVKSTFLANL